MWRVVLLLAQHSFFATVLSLSLFFFGQWDLTSCEESPHSNHLVLGEAASLHTEAKPGLRTPVPILISETEFWVQ